MGLFPISVEREGERMAEQSFWAILGMKPSKNLGEIRKAYALRAKSVHPEENPQGFLALKSAYASAIAYAKNSSSVKEGESVHKEQPSKQAKKTPMKQGKTEKQGTLFQGLEYCLPLEHHPSLLLFRQLYLKEEEQNMGVWMDYFTSPEVLEVFLEEPYPREVVSVVLRQEIPYNLPFLKCLYLVYQMYQLPKDGEQWKDTSYARGMRYLMQMVETVGLSVLPPLTATELAFSIGFRDYYLLTNHKDKFFQHNVQEMVGNVLESYRGGNLYDSVPAIYLGETVFSPRLALSLRLLIFFV